VKMLADPAPAHDHAAKASLFEVPTNLRYRCECFQLRKTHAA
jgi:hypothetical protein